MPEPEKLEREPPETEMSDSPKSVEVSERVKVREADSPALREEVPELRLMVGLTVLTESVSELSGSEPSVFVLPAKSEKAAEATEITPSVVLLAVGVKVAE